jgi:hypothetical protein
VFLRLVADRETLPDYDEFGERAAIREFLGGYPRVEAERLALAEIASAIDGDGAQ